MFWDGSRWVEDRPLNRQVAPALPRSRRRHRGGLLTIVIVVLVPALLIPFPAVNAAGPRLTVSGSAAPGASVNLAGDGFHARTWIQLQWDGSAVGMSTVRTSNQGAFGTSLMIPAKATPGPHMVGAVESSSGSRSVTSAAATAALAVATVMVLDPTPGPTQIATPGPTQITTAGPTQIATPGPTQIATPGPTQITTPGPTQIVTATPSLAPTPTQVAHPTPTPDPAATPTPAPTPAPGISGLYGSAIGMDSLNNTEVGGPRNISTSYRFRASTSAKLNSVRVYIIGPTHAGYGAGTGGTWQVTVQTDNGAANHAPSGTVLATTTFKPVDGLPVIGWSSPASLTAGLLYHIVFENVDPDPTANYASVDGVFMYQPTAPRQPAFSNVNWGQPTRAGSGGWSDLSNTVPIMQLNYANGVTAGLGYMEVWVRSYKSISGNARAREAFTVSGSNRAVSSFSVRLMRTSGSSPLTVSLETSGGTLIEQGTISASAIAIGTPGDHGGSGHATWETCTFASPQTLVSGQAYNVVLSTASDTVYSIFVIRKGSSWGFGPTTYFSNGHAQYTTGSSWGPFTQDGGKALDQGDLQFYFR